MPFSFVAWVFLLSFWLERYLVMVEMGYLGRSNGSCELGGKTEILRSDLFHPKTPFFYQNLVVLSFFFVACQNF